ncbi:MAG: DNA repair protein RecN [Lachnospiraceae bacterium]|nr:DNA repair protein RecN [Lachnospiraceae bacterium]
MLVSLHVKNLALIEELEVYFGPGVNILTGETGAGKSIIMGSINLALGGKADKGLIRTGAEYALVELVFQTENEEQEEMLKEMDIPQEEDGTVIVLRRLMPERSLCKVNGVTVSQKQLKELASLFINIHGQHDNQTLLNVKKYSHILDEYGAEPVETLKNKLGKVYSAYLDVHRELQNSSMDEKEKAREIALSSFEIEEIKEAVLQVGEDAELEEQYRKMVNSKRIAGGVAAAYDCTGYGASGSAGESVSRALRELKAVASYDEALEELTGQLSEIEDLLNDFNRSLVDYQQSLEFEPEEFDRVEKRLNLYNRLKDKYGNTVEDILAYCRKKEEELEKLEDYDLYLESLKKKEEEYYQELLGLCSKLSELRKKYALQLAKKLKKGLQELNFLSVELEIRVETDPGNISAEGYDQVDFFISLNPGEPMQSISKVASGGELSRIMLALKAVMADKEEIGTLIFDEIDAGISGKTAWKVSEKMALLGKAHQLLCITHLPQIAAMADRHFVIEKNTEEGRSVTHISEIREEEILHELARLLSGTTVTDAVLANARELKDLAVKTKSY